MQCNYCEKNEALMSDMAPVCDLTISSVYLMRDQTHKGRCVVAFHQHKEEVFELTDEERNVFFADVNRVAVALRRLYTPGKINLAIYGDTVRHFHVHVVPKYPDMEDYGGAFSAASTGPVLLDNETLQKRICEIKDSIMEGSQK